MEMIKNRFILAFTVALLTTLLTAFAQDTEKPPTNQFVEISISGALSEVKPTFALGTVPTTPLNNILKSIDKIEENKRIIGVIIRIGGIDTGWGKLQEIRNRLINLRQNGKMVISYLDSANNAEYLLATATEQIILAPAGTVGLTGLRAEVMFYKRILDKFEIKANMFAIGDYKSAIEPYTRENMSEAQKYGRASIKHDVSVPVSKTAEFVLNASKIVKEELPGIHPAAFGHLGDGNIHFNLTQPADMDSENFLNMWDHFNKLVNDYVATLNGSFSAEHGIGEVKRDELARYGDPIGIELMRTVKKSLDPKNIMNPGKVVPEF